MGFALFRVAVQYLPIFPKDDMVHLPSPGPLAVSMGQPVLEHGGD